MRLSILVILLTVSQLVQSQSIKFTSYMKGASNVKVELRRAIYEDTTFVGWWLEKEVSMVKLSSTKYEITLPINNQYIVTFIDPITDKWKLIYIEPGNIASAKNAFTVTSDFSTTDGLSVLYNYDTKMFLFRPFAR